jgi:hypothetical protein
MGEQLQKSLKMIGDPADTLSILEMQKKLQEVISPSSSKPEEEEYYNEQDEDGLHIVNGES